MHACDNLQRNFELKKEEKRCCITSLCSLICLRVYFITTQNLKVTWLFLKPFNGLFLLMKFLSETTKISSYPPFFWLPKWLTFVLSLGLSIFNIHCPWHVCCDHGTRKGDNQSYENESMIFSVSETWRLMAKTWVIAVSCFAGFEALESQPALKMKRQRY